MVSEWSPSDVNNPGTRPGIYIRFIQQALDLVNPGSRGIVGIISESDWGDPNVVIDVADMRRAADYFTNVESSTSRLYRLARLAFLGGALQVKAVRVMNTNNAAKASSNLVDGSATNVITLTARYEGTYGGQIVYDVGADPVDATKTRIRIYVANQLVHSITSVVDSGDTGFIDNIVDLINDLESPWVTATKVADGDNDLAAVATATALTGGSNGDAVDATNFNNALALFAGNQVHILTSDVGTAAVQDNIAAWVEDRRSEGYRLMTVMGSDLGDSINTIIADAQRFNSPGVVYVGPGVTMPNTEGDLVSYSGATMAAFVAGAIAGVDPSRSVTAFQIPGATRPEILATVDQVRSMNASGVLALTSTPFGADPGVRIERGLTTLYDPGEDDIAQMKLIRQTRVLDAVVEGLQVAAQNNIIGRQLNDVQGRNAVVDMVRDLLRTLASQRYIDTVYEVTIDEQQDNTGPNLYLNIGIRPIDSIEFIWTTITLLS